ncbi:iron chelate uptake ABC transporter family permease subunit [Crassaminicella thermophila]|uniref:Iron chelate uptake ABC transporter family permease subunit n=1 Tax=Crassaminicella thermophila TaxID=2599308 RepID=A0A5C0SH92_CRATE|nr:iron chelate uptake ABC transporter family permease subunit [Crassaminicella thermophila]QEK13352.1 iron chelate uptake ABC transporter family permease subunit [Crassaminicella thermophila]
MTYIQKRRYYWKFFIVIFALLCICIFFVSTLGVAKISFAEAYRILLRNVPLIGRYISIDDIKESKKLIILNIRFPRILLSALVGMALAGAGAVFQGIFKNPMADPYVLGVSSGAAFGATIAIIFGLEEIFIGFRAITVMAFVGAILATLTVYNLSKIGSKTPIVTLLLAGIALSFLLSSLISLLMTFHREQVERIVFWTMGSFSAASWKHVRIAAPIILIGCIFFTMFGRDLNVMLMGEETAKSLGIEVERIKKVLLVAASIVAASAVSVSGIIGFVGLVIPHIGRLIIGPDHRVLIPFTLISGAIFMVVADTLARILIPPAEIPVGVITSLVGAPFFIYLLYKNKKQNSMG